MIAACLSIVGHEAIGHGGACLAAGGRVILLNIVDFKCSVARPWIDLAGPAGNLVLALAGLALTTGKSGVRLLGLALFAFNAFWIAGYFLYAAILGAGDFVYPLSLAMSENVWRAVTGLAGLGLYRLTLRGIVVTTPPEAATPLRTAYVAASLAAILASGLYRPAPTHTMTMAALEFGAASLGLWFAVREARGRGDWTRPASPVWIGSALVMFAALTAIQGPGLPR